MRSTALFTDRYEFTMLQAALSRGTAGRRSVFEVFARHLPAGRRYGVVAGTGRLIEAISNFTFTQTQLDYLSDFLNEGTLQWLANFSFSGDIWGYAEGECFFPYSPILIVEAPFAEGVLLETIALSILNHDCAVATAASRMTFAAQGRPIIEMGSRRTHEYAAQASARAAYLAGFSATSNLAAGERYGIPTTGTSAHSFTLLHDSERDAFVAQVAAMGSETTLLVDTYDVDAGVRTAVEVAGPELGGVRLDSGDLAQQAVHVRELLNQLDATNTRIVVTSDLDEFAIDALSSAPVDVYGVGTAVVTGSGSPTAALVYKLVAREDQTGRLVAVAKKSADKASVGDRKYALRRRSSDGVAEAEILGIGHPPGNDGDDKALLVPLIRAGQQVWFDTLAQARARHQMSVRELPPDAMKLSRGVPVIPTLFQDQPNSGIS